MTTKIQKWGNSYAVRLPKAVIERLGLGEGHAVEIQESMDGGSFSIVPMSTNIPPLKELLARVRNENIHPETDWGGEVGKEIW